MPNHAPIWPPRPRLSRKTPPFSLPYPDPNRSGRPPVAGRGRKRESHGNAMEAMKRSEVVGGGGSGGNDGSGGGSGGRGGNGGNGSGGT